jgi:D-alanyl-lipoteichoic acid acyltransferase DltB (MBOAT superfamily)
MAGPIERADGFFKQLQGEVLVDNAVIRISLLRIFVGLVRKIVISDMITRLIPVGVFAYPRQFPILDLLFWWIVFAFIVYNDFAGYTSIARGISGLFGIQLSPNFEQPFFSTSYIDFWNRWHISLSNWLRDYIYLPVSRSLLRRNPSGRYWPNLMIPPAVTMLVSGLWHGLNPHFLLWGFLNGLLQGIERLQKSRRKPSSAAPPKWRQQINIALTLAILLLISVPFKLDLTQSFDFWTGLVRWTLPQTLVWSNILRPTLGVGISLWIDFLYLPEKDEKGLLKLSKRTQVLLLTIGLFLLFLGTREQTPAPFIYQEF